jgi:hypothetical protein
VFLLDDRYVNLLFSVLHEMLFYSVFFLMYRCRFMGDKQVAQLSGWVRSRVCKYRDFQVALKSFRAFVTKAALDKTLVSKVVINSFYMYLPILRVSL